MIYCCRFPSVEVPDFSDKMKVPVHTMWTHVNCGCHCRLAQLSQSKEATSVTPNTAPTSTTESNATETQSVNGRSLQLCQLEEGGSDSEVERITNTALMRVIEGSSATAIGCEAGRSSE